jgi:spore coat protein CotH
MRSRTLLPLVVGVLLAHPGPLAAQSFDDFLNPGALQRIDVSINSGDWQQLKDSVADDTYYPARLEWNGVVVRNVGIRSRGGGSRSGTKPGLRVDIDRYQTSERFLGVKSFVLDNLVQDASGIRETLAMQVHARLAIPAPREAHARLYVNNEYAGTYVAIEAVDKRLLARVFGIVEDDTQNDGYLFDYAYVDEWRFGYLGADLAPYEARLQAETKANAPAEEKYRPIEELTRLINETSADRLEGAIADRLDLDQTVRYVAVQNYIAQNDGLLGYAGMNNFYLYRLEGQARHVWIAWDEDNALLASDFALDTRHGDNVLFDKLMQIPRLRTLYYQTLLEVAATTTEGGDDTNSGWLQREADRQTAMIAEAMRQDVNKPYSNDEFEAVSAQVSAFNGARAAYVRCHASRALGQPLPTGCQ